MLEKCLSEFLQTLLAEARHKGLKVRKRKDGGVVIYTGKKKLTIILEEINE